MRKVAATPRQLGDPPVGDRVSSPRLPDRGTEDLRHRIDRTPRASARPRSVKCKRSGLRSLRTCPRRPGLRRAPRCGRRRLLCSRRAHSGCRRRQHLIIKSLQQAAVRGRVGAGAKSGRRRWKSAPMPRPPPSSAPACSSAATDGNTSAAPLAAASLQVMRGRTRCRIFPRDGPRRHVPRWRHRASGRPLARRRASQQTARPTMRSRVTPSARRGEGARPSAGW